MKLKIAICLLLVCYSLAIVSCKKTDAPLSNKIDIDTSGNHKPVSPTDTTKKDTTKSKPGTPIQKLSPIDSVNLTINLSNQGNSIINTAIQNISTSNTTLDVLSVFNQLKAISGIKSVELSPSGTLINVQRTDGAYFGLSLFDRGDDRLVYEGIPPKTESSNKLKVNSITDIPSITHVTPGNRKALILAPFDNYFHENLTIIKSLLSDAGYSITCPKPEEININYFKGDYLAQFGIIYISTHGKANYTMNVGTQALHTTVFSTGIKYSPTLALSPDYLYTLNGRPTGYNDYYFDISIPFLKRTLSKKFPNSWVFVNSCESLQNNDLADFFISNGAKAFNGNKEIIDDHVAQTNAIEFFAFITAGKEYGNSYLSIKEDQGIQGNRISKISPGRFYNSLSYYLTDATPFYFVDKINMNSFINPGFNNTGQNTSFYATVSGAIDPLVSSVYVTNNLSTNITPTIGSLSVGGNFGGIGNDDTYTGDDNINITTDIYPKAVIFYFTATDKSGKILAKSWSPYTIVKY